MKTSYSKKRIRTGVVINYFGLAGSVVIWEFCSNSHWSNTMIIAGIVSFILLLSSLILTYFTTRIWQFNHMPVSKLDERELQITSHSLRYAYGIFTVIAVVTFYLYSLAELQVSVILAGGMLYFSHILPASIIAWTVK
ncbi:MAG: hypothetical protein IMY71_06945 [Bacteroidetes bacterium]|nr:hypothetical protein [Bacteroidota bacterium]